MFEAISKTTQPQGQTQEAVSVSSKIDPPVSARETEKAKDSKLPEDGRIQKGKKEGRTKESRLPDALLKDLEEDFRMIHNVGLKFSLHEETGRTVVKVINKDNGKLIREIPPENVLNLAAKLDEMIGIIFDEKV